MKEYFEELFKEAEQWRVESFLRKMKHFQVECTTNEQEDFIKVGINWATKKLEEFKSIPSTAETLSVLVTT